MANLRFSKKNPYDIVNMGVVALIIWLKEMEVLSILTFSKVVLNPCENPTNRIITQFSLITRQLTKIPILNQKVIIAELTNVIYVPDNIIKMGNSNSCNSKKSGGNKLQN